MKLKLTQEQIAEDEARKFVDTWLWENEKRETTHLDWPRNYKADAVQMVLAATEKARSTLEAKSRECDRLRADLLNPPIDVQERVIQMLNLVSRDALEAKERECEQLKATTSERAEETRKTEKTLNNEFENSKSLTAQLIKVQERLNKLVNLVWTTRWVSEEEDYQKLLGIAAAIRSGNYEPIDAMGKGEGKA